MNTSLRLAPFLLAAAVSGLTGAVTACGRPGPVETTVPGMPAGYRNRYYQGMRYGLFVPPSYDRAKKYPLIIYLHGSTDTTTWDLNWYHDPVQSEDPVFVITPKSLESRSGWGTSWDSFIAPDLENTLDVLAAIEREFSIDTTRLYVHGTSMGGFGVFNLLSKRPGLFAGAYAVCGGGDPTTAQQMKQTPLWIFHGSADPVVPVTYSRGIYAAIREAGGTQVRYTEYPGVGHDAWTPVGKEGTLPHWLLAQRQGVVHGAPDAVLGLRVAAVDSARPSLAWVPPADTTAAAERKVWFYRVYRDQTLVAEVGVTVFTDAVLPAHAAYGYSVASVNYYFKEGPRASVQATIP